ncbi:MAG: 50S ribosomal protein L25 [Candidatus Muiribacteriota bacterium]|jgi:large subunit ribosomal protein L25
MILECKKREGTGKEKAKKIRAEKNIPGIIYGKKMDPISIVFKANEFEKFLRHNHGKPIYSINLEGEEKMVVIKEKQQKPWRNEFVHIDFQEIHKGETIHLNIPIHFHGVAEVEKKGGILVKNMHELEIACMVKDIPNSFDVDVSTLDLNHSIRISDLNISEDIKVYADENSTVCSVTVPRAAIEEAAEAAEVTEPEVIGKGKKEEEEEAE